MEPESPSGANSGGGLNPVRMLCQCLGRRGGRAASTSQASAGGADHGDPRRQVAESLFARQLQLVREAREAFGEQALQRAIEQSKRAYLLSELPRELYCAERHGCVVTECELCLEEYAEKDELVRLPCMHIFHASCASPWLLQAGTCPVCLTELDQASATMGAETTQDSSRSSAD
mmetsp:Transcript_45303/g.129765  ORF Transcript_45303/g.129765 Transcript_45303/m.129765 type:complete len:175 (-) Transcript_45303:78-602(-)